MTVFFALVGAGLLIAALSGAALSWDGGHYLFNILDRRAPFILHDRAIVVPLHLLVLLAQHATENMYVLRLIFGLADFSIPLVALGLSWFMVRDHAPALFMWPAFAIGLATLPGQLYVGTEATIAVQLFWPVLLAIVLGMPPAKIPAAIVVVALLFICHPFAIPLLAFGSILALVMGVYLSAERWKMWWWAAGLAVVTGVRIAWFLLAGSAYEAHMISVAIAERQFRGAVAGLPLMALVAAYLAGGLVWLSPALSRWGWRSGPVVAHTLARAGIATAGALLLWWASDPRRWTNEQDFRSCVLLAALPFMILTALEALANGENVARRTGGDWRRRARTAQLIALAFALVLSCQAVVWSRLTTGLRNAMAAHADGCVPAAWSDAVWGTPLYDWGLTTYSIVLQGRVPRQVVLQGSACAELRHSTALPIGPAWVRAIDGGWFDLGPLFARLQSTTPANDCWLARESGWYEVVGR